MRDQLRCHGRSGWIDGKASIITLPVCTFCGTLKSGFWRGDNGRLSNDEQVNRLAALSLKRSKSVDLVTIGSGTRKMFMPKQKLHTHEEVFKDHVSGQYDETIFRFRVPGGWILHAHYYPVWFGR